MKYSNSSSERLEEGLNSREEVEAPQEEVDGISARLVLQRCPERMLRVGVNYRKVLEVRINNWFPHGLNNLTTLLRWQRIRTSHGVERVGEAEYVGGKVGEERMYRGLGKDVGF